MPFIIGAYVLMWVAILVYVLMIMLGYKKAERQMAVLEEAVAELNEKNKRFMIADIKKGLRYDRVEDSFTWLWKAGVALGVFNTTEPTVPLMLNEKSTLFKLFLSDVGLDYLTLARATGTLSGGEAQRIRLATQIGSGLVGVAYILDEPSIGLHQRDNVNCLKDTVPSARSR